MHIDGSKSLDWLLGVVLLMFIVILLLSILRFRKLVFASAVICCLLGVVWIVFRGDLTSEAEKILAKNGYTAIGFVAGLTDYNADLRDLVLQKEDGTLVEYYYTIEKGNITFYEYIDNQYKPVDIIKED